MNVRCGISCLLLIASAIRARAMRALHGLHADDGPRNSQVLHRLLYSQMREVLPVKTSEAVLVRCVHVRTCRLAASRAAHAHRMLSVHVHCVYAHALHVDPSDVQAFCAQI
eukprot:6184737-Pleurochrysis_carterae.AAC.4